MRKGLSYPKTFEEAKKRIKTSLFQSQFDTTSWDYDAFERRVAYRQPAPRGAARNPFLKKLQGELDRERRKLSMRVARIYRRTKRLSVVCDLLRHSPVFLTDRWVNDLLMERKRTVMLDPDVKSRYRALKDLKELTMAIVSERLPSGQWRRKKKWQPLRADRPRGSILQTVTPLRCYAGYMDIAMCLRAVRDLTSGERAREHPRKPDREAITVYADRLVVPREWLQTFWSGRARSDRWAHARMAELTNGTPGGVRRRLEDARRRHREELVAMKPFQDAEERLRADRGRRASERLKKGGVGVYRRY